MKNRFHSGQRPLFAMVMVFCLMLMAPLSGNAAELVDISRPCSLTVRCANAEELPEDLEKAGVVVDLYQVAGAVLSEDREWYSFALYPPFEQLELKNNLSAAQWRALSQKAAGIALSSGAVQPVRADIPIGTRIENLDAGLYLMAARGGGLEDYVDTNADGDIVTKACTGGYTYTFLPELIALPGSAPDTDKWLYDVEIVLKMQWEKNEQYGSVKIVKTLEGYDGSHGPAVFVFDVEVELDGKNVYSNVVTIVFDKPGVEQLLVEGIPVGARVTVTEVYSGACYTLVTDKTKTVTISAAQEILTVSFTNRYDERPNGGHGITNHFRYGEDGWKLEQVYDKAQG